MKNPYLVMRAKITDERKEAEDVKTIRFSLIDVPSGGFRSVPGQFLMASVFGFGEATFGIVPTEKEDEFEFSFRRTGTVTEALFGLKAGETIGIRGPFGNGYPVGMMKGKDITLLSGGIGFPPIKSLLLHLLKDSNRYGNISLYYGARSPEDVIYKKELSGWEKTIDVHVTVDNSCGLWSGCIGTVADMLKDKSVSEKELAFMCGHPLMMKSACEILAGNGMKPDKIYVSLERLMKCGMGVCGHCNIGGFYVCKDGPVIRLDRLLSLDEKVW